MAISKIRQSKSTKSKGAQPRRRRIMGSYLSIPPLLDPDFDSDSITALELRDIVAPHISG